MHSKVQFFQARVNCLHDDHGVIHFLIQEDEGRSMIQCSEDVWGAGFLSFCLNSPLYEMANRAELTEMDEETFARRRGARIPAGEVSGMTFWWLK